MRRELYLSFFVLTVFLSVTSVFAQSENLVIKPYGFLKFDMAYDGARTNNGNYVFWVNENPKSVNTSEFNMTTRQTRFGANLSYEGTQDKKVTARLEFDFYGGGAENKNMPMLRHSFFKIDFGKYYLLAGQASDIFSPLVPTTVNYTVLWNSGNIGYRHPQIQFGYLMDSGFEMVGALSRNIPGDFDEDGNDDGESSSMPTVQARFSYINPKLNVGISGHYGRIKFVRFDNCNGCDSYSINAHYSYSIIDAIQIKGELFQGRTLNQYFGGIGQGYDVKNGKGIESRGGWLNASLKTNKNMSFNLGIGVDKPQDKGVVSLEKNLNRCIFGNVYTKIAHNTTFAIELSDWKTGYIDEFGNETDKMNFRVQTSLILNL